MREVTILFCAAAGLLGQSFEAASVKPAAPEQSAVDLVVSPGGYLRITNLTLLEMAREAYAAKYWQMSGGPGWIGTDRFNIEAKASGNPSRADVMAMLRTLLADRFQLWVRRETREGSIYELVAAKGGPKLKPSTATTSFLRLMRNTPPELPGVSYTIEAQKVSMARLADDLMGKVQHPVIDRTGIAGEFDFRVDYAVDGHAEVGPSIYTALQEQAGLKLQPAKGPIEMFVVEKAERPGAN